MAAQVLTVHDAMIACGVNDANVYDGMTPAERLAFDVFIDEFETCMDKTFDELDSDFKSYSELTVAQGQIRLLPGTKRNVKAFIQWVRDERRLGRDPSNTPFPVAQAAALLRRYKTHYQYIKKSSTVSEAAKPDKFTSSTKWNDWYPSFLNYLRAIPGRNGVPLKYVCRPFDGPDPTPHPDFLDDYIAMAPLGGDAFAIDAAEVHTYLVNFIAGNNTAETKIQPHESVTNGRIDYIALKDHYEGVGIHANEITKAELTLKTLFYSGEKKPHMYWDLFEQELTHAYTIYDRREGRVVHSNEMKLRALISKVDADFLNATKAGIGIELTRIPMTMTFEQALASFRNEVNRKFPPQMTSLPRTRRYVNEVRGGRGRGYNPGRGRGPGRGHRNGQQRTRTDSKMISLTDGSVIEYHASFKFPQAIYAKFKQDDKDRLYQERQEWKKRKRGNGDGNRSVQSLQSTLADTQRQLRELQQQRHIQELRHQLTHAQSQSVGNHPTDISVNAHTQVSQVTGSTMMGGRNEQANRKRH
jgi:hypothetical protein